MCVACWASILYCTVCCMLGCSIVLHCVLHVGLQYWSIMHSCEISHFTTVCCMLGRSIVLRCVLYVGLQYWSIMHTWEILHFTTVCCMFGFSIVLHCVLHVDLQYCIAHNNRDNKDNNARWYYSGILP